MKKSLLFVLVALLGFPLAAAAAISGDCSGCHTMHNSEENAPVAVTGIGATSTSAAPIANLLKFDCVACHAQNTTKIVTLNSSAIPQVYHNDASGDLAAGNFRHITDGGTSANRKGHNVIDLFLGGDTTAATTYIRPPGFTTITGSAHDNAFGTGGDFSKFTCAGAAGCHGTRHQLDDTGARRVGMAAISGAHHQSSPGKRDPVQVLAGAHDGAKVAAGYRFIPGLKGIGNTNALAPWQNASSSSHNEYFGFAATLDFASGCTVCHVSGALGNTKSDVTSIVVPNQSMSGFCSTCHGDFHSSGTENGSSGAFLRHPSDFIIPAERGYEAYTAYNITAPVARNATAFAGLTGPSGVVNPGSDMVMCLSCHKAHASEYDAMLRFNYADMTAGGTGTNGCLACHTNK